jgi:DNA polymerase
MNILSIDIETYSSEDLPKAGVYKYAEPSDFSLLLFAYAIDDEPVLVVDCSKGERIPPNIVAALTDPAVIKTAFNANFERTCISAHLGIELPPEQWRCTAVHSLALGLPPNLDGVAKALGLDIQKDANGKKLIRWFCIPNKEGVQANPADNVEKWNQFIEYCRVDVEVERAIRKRLEAFPLLDREWLLWAIDQRINDYGVQVDPLLISQAINIDAEYTNRLEDEAKRLTGLDNPKSIHQLKGWLEANGTPVESLTKETVKKAKEQATKSDVKRVLAIRQELAKTSVSKYSAMGRALCRDSRIRGLLQFYGASRTGRWAGRLVQVQNLPQNKIDDLDVAREALLYGDDDTLHMLYGNVPDILSQLIRTAFVPKKDSRFIVADFSAIEARVIAWLAGEKWRMDVFATHGKIYEASASQMFKVPIESIDKGSPLRQKGKIAELALGYQGGVGALKAMGADKMGLSDNELGDLVKAWRKANPNICNLWADVEEAAWLAVREGKPTTLQYGLKFEVVKKILFITLPSGRKLAYVKPKIEVDGRFGREQITYEGTEQGTKIWGRLSTYGGKLVENIVQAVARDCLAESLIRLHQAGYKTVMHVHDEIVAEVPIGTSSADIMADIMGKPIEWAEGLLLTADAFETSYYRKD